MVLFREPGARWYSTPLSVGWRPFYSIGVINVREDPKSKISHTQPVDQWALSSLACLSLLPTSLIISQMWGQDTKNRNVYCLQVLTEESGLLKWQQSLIAWPANEAERELDLIPRELSPVVWAGSLHFYLLQILCRACQWAKLGQFHWFCIASWWDQGGWPCCREGNWQCQI